MNVFFKNFQKLVTHFVTFLWVQMLLEMQQSEIPKQKCNLRKVYFKEIDVFNKIWF